MKRFELLLFVIVLTINVSNAQNPILQKKDSGFIYAADPAAEVFNDKVYVYTSRDVSNATSFSTMQDYAVLESSDLKTWINHGGLY
ncbi:hypothetical protein [Polaribacter sargassicola]|uniref:hypothetical protein n=1 Tax=Polaribacter sargassicola TaxID=2836891 RepID=UPI001F1D1245|nr:hypothetical protein [Polaribacter sp. DS7-9]MCG1035807.1 hypothetical protein [Polaribacter sp. DS7-9]